MQPLIFNLARLLLLLEAVSQMLNQGYPLWRDNPAAGGTNRLLDAFLK
jgi:hypothetical protein